MSHFVQKVCVSYFLHKLQDFLFLVQENYPIGQISNVPLEVQLIIGIQPISQLKISTELSQYHSQIHLLSYFLSCYQRLNLFLCWDI